MSAAECYETALMPAPETGEVFRTAIEALHLRQKIVDPETGRTQESVEFKITRTETDNAAILALHGARVILHTTYDEQLRVERLTHSTSELTGSITAGTYATAEQPMPYGQAVQLQGGNEFTVRGIIRELLHDADTAQSHTLADVAIDSDALYMPAVYRPTFSHHAVHGFIDEGKLEVLLQAVHDRKDSPAVQGIVKELNMRAKQWCANAGKRQQGASLLEWLQQLDLLQPDQVFGIDMMIDPLTSHYIAGSLHKSNPFESMSPQSRRNMATMLLCGVLDRAAQPNSGRNARGAAAITSALFDPKSYKNDLALKDILTVANTFTERLNDNRPDEQQQTLLPVEGVGPAMMVNCGEAIY